MAPKMPSSMGTLPSTLTRSAALPSRTQPAAVATVSFGQTRAATYIHRPRRPYTFTQLIQLSDGSTFTARTTSPVALHKADKDSRNTLLWQPSEKTLKNIEHDEAGKLAAFRQRFGRGFDVSTSADAETSDAPIVQRRGGRALREADLKKLEEERQERAEAAKRDAEDDVLDLGDLISGYAGDVAEKPSKPRPGKSKK